MANEFSENKEGVTLTPEELAAKQQANLDAYQTELADLAGQIDDAKNALAQLQADIQTETSNREATIQSQLTGLKSDVMAAQLDKDLLTKELADLQTQIDEKVKERDNIRLDFDSQQADLDAKLKALSENVAHNNDLNKSIADKQAAYQANVEQLAKDQQAFEDLKAVELANIQKDRDDIAKQKAALDQGFGDLEAVRQKLIDETELAAGVKKDAEASFAQAQVAVADREKFEKAKADLEVQVASAQKRDDELQSKENQLKILDAILSDQKMDLADREQRVKQAEQIVADKLGGTK